MHTLKIIYTKKFGNTLYKVKEPQYYTSIKCSSDCFKAELHYIMQKKNQIN